MVMVMVVSNFPNNVKTGLQSYTALHNVKIIQLLAVELLENGESTVKIGLNG